MYRRGRKEQQISIEDRFMNLPVSIVENLRKSWAEQFYQNRFLSIAFAVLYSSEYSRPKPMPSPISWPMSSPWIVAWLVWIRS
jgi:hypothetical protein